MKHCGTTDCNILFILQWTKYFGIFIWSCNCMVFTEVIATRGKGGKDDGWKEKDGNDDLEATDGNTV